LRSTPDEIHEVGFGKARGMHLFAETKKAAKAHDERAPFFGVNVRTRFIPNQQRLFNMQA
jgi:hypothetical protein